MRCNHSVILGHARNSLSKTIHTLLFMHHATSYHNTTEPDLFACVIILIFAPTTLCTHLILSPGCGDGQLCSAQACEARSLRVTPPSRLNVHRQVL